MASIYWLNQIQPNHHHTVVDKAFYLSYLMQHNYPVPSGFVVATHLFWEFLETIDWLGPLLQDWPHSTLYFPVDDARQLQIIAQSIRHQIMAAPLQPELISQLEIATQSLEAFTLIIRPSLTSSSLSTTGLLDSHLCVCDIAQISLALKRAWAEFFRARNLFYWQRSGIHLRQLQPTVLIQSIYPAIASGCVEITPTEWTVKATFGLGFSMVWGHVIPDSYQVDAENQDVSQRQLGQKTLAYNLISSSIASPQNEFNLPILARYPNLKGFILQETEQNRYVLDEQQLQALIVIIQNAIKDLGSPFNFEWTLIESNQDRQASFYITQAMPSVIPATSNPAHSFSLARVPVISNAAPPSLTASQPINLDSPVAQFQGQGVGKGTVTATVTIMTHDGVENPTFPPGHILVASAILPRWLSCVTQATGIITEQGGLTSHGAILARELGIPAVVGVPDITYQLQTGETVTLDGDQGIIYRRSELLPAPVSSESTPHFTSEPPIPHPDFFIPLSTQLLANISQPQYLSDLKTMPIDGIGLLRAEFMLADFLGRYAPDQWLSPAIQAEFSTTLTQFLIEFATALHPRPIRYRALDLREFLQAPQRTEGVKDRWILLDLELQVLAHLYESGYTNIQLIFPFVRDLPEFIALEQRVRQAGLIPKFPLQLWIMAEVPSVLFLLPEYVKAGVKGIAIGTNDLTQLLLGQDRHHEVNTPLVSPHPVVMAAIHQLISQSETLGIPCTICGDLPSLYPETIESLIEWGITGISVNYEALPHTYQTIARVEKRLLLKATRQLEKKSL